MRYSLLHRWFVCCVALCLVSCASLFEPEGELEMESVSIYADLDANDNSATTVELVLAYSGELCQALSQLSADKYFAASKQLLLDNPGLLDIWHWELVPGQVVDKFKPPQPKGEAFGAYVFADYLTPGEHRLKVPCTGVLTVMLLKSGMKSVCVSECLQGRRRGETASMPGWQVSGESYDEMCDVKSGPLQSSPPQPTCFNQPPEVVRPYEPPCAMPQHRYQKPCARPVMSPTPAGPPVAIQLLPPLKTR